MIALAARHSCGRACTSRVGGQRLSQLRAHRNPTLCMLHILQLRKFREPLLSGILCSPFAPCLCVSLRSLLSAVFCPHPTFSPILSIFERVLFACRSVASILLTVRWAVRSPAFFTSSKTAYVFFCFANRFV